MATPTSSMACVRPVFDQRGGAIARAFYMVSNYMLQYEIQQQFSRCCNTTTRPVIVVDRWYSSTCAYSVAWKNTKGGPEAIDALEDALFQWPLDLHPPDLQLLLQVDDPVRKERVRDRRSDDGQARRSNWDNRLDQDENLGRRIMRALERVQGRPPHLECVILNANQTKEQVLQDALSVVTERVRRHFVPWEYFDRQPLQFFVWNSAQLGWCDPQTGRHEHNKHEPWAVQLALNSTDDSSAPSLQSVGIHTADETGILMFTRGHAGGGSC